MLVASVKVTLNQTEVKLQPGECAELIAQITPLESTDTVTWESSNPEIAEVIEGVVTAKSDGVATIRAYTESGVMAVCNVMVETIYPVSSVSIPKTLSLYRSKTYQMTADVLPVNATDKTLIWESMDPSIVSVDANGLLKANAKGSAKIKVTTSNGITQECTVTVLVASVKVTLNQTEVELYPGESVELTAQIAPLDSTDTITWESSNPEVAEVIEGVVVAKDDGVATISAYTESGIRATCKVTVNVCPSAIGTSLTIDASKCKVKVLSSNLDEPTVEYIASTNKNATLIKIPNTVTDGEVTYKVVSIAPEAFKNNKKIKKVTIGSNVTTIGSKAFYNCSSLTSITIPSKVTKIDSYAFMNCKKILSVTIGSSVKTIGKEAFRNCGKLKKITIKSMKLKTVGKNALKGIHSNATVKVPASKLQAYKKLLKNKGQGKQVKITK